MTDDITTLRRRQKNRFLNRFNEIKKSKFYVSSINALDLNEYETRIACAKYKKEIVTADSYAYSAEAKVPLAQIFNTYPNDLKCYLNDKINHLVDTGTMIIFSHKKTHKVIASMGMLDLCDSYWKKNNYQHYPLNLKHLMEVASLGNDMFLETAIKNKNNKYMQQLVKIFQSKNKSIYFGNWCEPTSYFVIPEFRGKHIPMFLYCILNDIIATLGYKHKLYKASNPISVYQLKTENMTLLYKTIPLINFVLNDGTKIKDFYNHNDSNKFNHICHHYYAVEVTPMDLNLAEKYVMHRIMRKRSKL